MRKLCTVLKLLFLICCFAIVFSGHHPPANAQDAPAPPVPSNIYGVEIQAAVQQSNIINQQKQIDKLEEQLANVKAEEDDNASNISGLRGAGEGAAALLGILQVLIAVLGRKKGAA